MKDTTKHECEAVGCIEEAAGYYDTHDGVNVRLCIKHGGVIHGITRSRWYLWRVR